MNWADSSQKGSTNSQKVHEVMLKALSHQEIQIKMTLSAWQSSRKQTATKAGNDVAGVEKEPSTPLVGI
jgi:hypothetical protein